MRAHEALVAQITGGSVGADTPPAPLPVVPEAMPRPIRVALTPQTHQGLLDFTNGKTGRPTRDAVRRFVTTCAAVAAGRKLPPAANASAATLVLSPDLQASLAWLHGDGSYEWSDAALGAVFHKLNPLIH